VACLHALHVMMTPLACASCRCLSSCERPSVMCEPCNLTVVAEYFFIHLLWVVGHVAALKPSRARGRVQSRITRGSSGALPCREAGLEPWVAWRPQSPLVQIGGVRSHMTRGSPESSRAGR
jgi:hypothetical protein